MVVSMDQPVSFPDTSDTSTVGAEHRPPGPKGLPLVGSLLAFGRDKLDFLTRNARLHGDIVLYDLAGWATVQLNNSDDIEQVLVKNHRNFIKNTMIWRHFAAIFGQGILTAEGEFWQKNRKLAAPAFAGQQLLGYAPDMVALTKNMLGTWQPSQVFDIHHEMMALTLRIAAKTLMDSEVEQDVADMDAALNDLTVEMAARAKRPILIPDWVPLPGHIRYRRAIATCERVISRMIAQRRSQGTDGRSDFLSRLMQARDADGNGLSDQQLRDETVTMLLAGHETTALALSWTFCLLGQHAEVQRRLLEEVAQVLGGRDATIDDVEKLTFTEAVIQESMRLYPPAWIIGRESVGPFKVGGYEFGPQTMVIVSAWVLHRHAKHFDDPEAFHPERWLGPQSLPRYAYMPFGGGPRVCIGQRFAMIEAVLLLATIAQRFGVIWQSDRPVTPFPSITLRPGGGVWVQLAARGELLH
jgi:cytochrome P450